MIDWILPFLEKEGVASIICVSLISLVYYCVQHEKTQANIRIAEKDAEVRNNVALADNNKALAELAHEQTEQERLRALQQTIQIQETARRKSLEEINGIHREIEPPIPLPPSSTSYPSSVVYPNSASYPSSVVYPNGIAQSDTKEQLPINAQDVSCAPVLERHSSSNSKVPWTQLALAGVAVVLLLLIIDHIFSSPFEDVTRDDYYLNAVKWAYQNRITTGTDKTHFDPDGSCTRGHIVTFLRRAVSSPKPELETLLSDNSHCTRGEVIVYLWIVIEQPNYVQIEWTSSFRYYYGDAVTWAISNGITDAQSLEEFSAYEPCLRKHAVTFLYRARKLL